MAELKHCPFCGGEAVVWQIPFNTEAEQALHPKWTWNYPGMWIVGCDTDMCYANHNNMAMIFYSRKEATEVWNRRAE
jgi:hypothetical protein